MSIIEISNYLKEFKVIKSKYIFISISLIFEKHRSLKAGEYDIPLNSSYYEILDIIYKGKSIKRYLIIPEGYTVYQALELIKNNQILDGNIESIPLEGSILPASYEYIYGDKRQYLLNKMVKAMDKYLNKLWEEKNKNLPYSSPKDALILASIIEKESSIQEEQKHIAGVFLNRMNKGMKLQSDPSVIYGIFNGKTFNYKLSYKDLKKYTKYNTYMIKNLPPTPISCPGKSSLKAVFNPKKTNDLYFVFNKSKNKHIFSKNFDIHRSNIRNIRSMKSACFNNKKI